MQFNEVGRFLITAGLVILAVGFLFLVADKLPIGRLPGDINIEKDGFKLFIPVTTCILVSIVITLIVNFLAGR